MPKENRFRRNAFPRKNSFHFGGGIEMAVRVAINGFGRIGRLAFRQDVPERGRSELNQRSDKLLTCFLHTCSSMIRPMAVTTAPQSPPITPSSCKRQGDRNLQGVRTLQTFPGGKFDIDVEVLECTGFYTSKEKSMAHIKAGAKHVVISAPAGIRSQDHRLHGKP